MLFLPHFQPATQWCQILDIRIDMKRSKSMLIKILLAPVTCTLSSALCKCLIIASLRFWQATLPNISSMGGYFPYLSDLCLLHHYK
jgi:hypothetical protein